MMHGTVKLLIVTFITWQLTACGNPGIERNRLDSDGLVRYAMPSEWTNTVISSGDHYTRVGESGDSPVLAVVARPRNSVPTIEQIQEGTKGKHVVQGHTLIEESTNEQNGFTVWEAIFEAKPRGQNVIYHDVFLFTDELQVEVNLNASRSDYEKLYPDLRFVADSVQLNTIE